MTARVPSVRKIPDRENFTFGQKGRLSNRISTTKQPGINLDEFDCRPKWFCYINAKYVIFKATGLISELGTSGKLPHARASFHGAGCPAVSPVRPGGVKEKYKVTQKSRALSGGERTHMEGGQA